MRMTATARAVRALAAASALCLAAGRLAAQSGDGDPLSNAGVVRASAAVDSVFIDRIVRESWVGGGDFASYLMARLGIRPIPHDLRLRVSVDTLQILLHGRIEDLPWEARRALGPLFSFFGPDTPVAAHVDLVSAGPRAVRFRLAAVSINGLTVPDRLLQAVMSQVGEQYPALTHTGRDLFVEIPPTAQVLLDPGGVRLVGPDAAQPGQP